MPVIVATAEYRPRLRKPVGRDPEGLFIRSGLRVEEAPCTPDPVSREM